jgi:hypothetical protein
MTEQEYRQELERIKKMERDLKQRYIESNYPIPPKSLVKVGEKILYLDRYVIINGDIRPTLYCVTPTMKPAPWCNKQEVKNWREMQPYKPSNEDE